MRYLDKLRAGNAAKNIFAGDPSPPKLTKPHEHAKQQLTELTKPSSVSFAGATPPTKTFSPTTSTLERRRRKVIDMLRADVTRRYAYDVQGASPKGQPSVPVSVMLGVRDTSETIVTGELTVPPDRWDMAAFITYWNSQTRPS